MAHVSTLEGKDNAPSRNSHDTDTNADTIWKAETAPNQKKTGTASMQPRSRNSYDALTHKAETA